MGRKGQLWPEKRVTHGEALFWKRSRGDSRVGRGVHGSLGAGEGRWQLRAGGGGRARLTPVAGPLMLRRAKTATKKANYPKMWPPDRFPPSLLFPELFSTVLKPLAAVVKSLVPTSLG